MYCSFKFLFGSESESDINLIVIRNFSAPPGVDTETPVSTVGLEKVNLYERVCVGVCWVVLSVSFHLHFILFS